MKNFVVFVREIGNKEVIKYVGTDENIAKEVYNKNNINFINYDHWIEIWDGEKILDGNWKPTNESSDK